VGKEAGPLRDLARREHFFLPTPRPTNFIRDRFPRAEWVDERATAFDANASDFDERFFSAAVTNCDHLWFEVTICDLKERDSEFTLQGHNL
jgi:hypothetical protein